MPAGRPPKPTALKLLQGNPGKRTLPKNEPKPPDGEINPPAWLTGRARRTWRELVPILESMRVLTTADPQALALFCDAYAEYIEARAVVKREGATYRTFNQAGSLMYRPRPEVAIASDAWRRATLMLGQFGMTPSSRAKVQTQPGEDVDPFEDFINGGRSTG